MSKRKIAAILAGTSAVGIINSGTSVAFASEREKELALQANEIDKYSTTKIVEYESEGTINLSYIEKSAITAQVSDKWFYVEGHAVSEPNENNRIKNNRLALIATDIITDSKGVSHNGYVRIVNSSGYDASIGSDEMPLTARKWINAGQHKYFYYGNHAFAGVVGFCKIDGKLYYFIKEDGRNQGKLYQKAGWADNLGGKKGKFYVNSDGSLATGQKNIGGIDYFFGDDGVLLGKEIQLTIKNPNITITEGQEYNLLQNVTSVGADGLDANNKITFELNDFNPENPQVGEYEVGYILNDAGQVKKETCTITVKGIPKFLGLNDVIIEEGSRFDPIDGVTATDNEDGPISLSAQNVTYSDGFNPEYPQVGSYVATYTVRDRDGNEVSKDRKITVTAKPVENKLPTINAPMTHEIYVGDYFDPLAIATANDPEDGKIKLTSANIVFNKVNNQKPGEYKVKYQVIDKQGGRTSKVITVVVKERPITNRKPIVKFPEKTVIKVGSTFNPIADVTATDYKGESIAISMSNVAWNKVNTKTPGDYQVKYRVSDTEGNAIIVYRTVTVEADTVTPPPSTSKKPTIEYAYDTIKTGTTFDPLDGVTAKDYKGNPIVLNKSNVSWNKVNTKTPGTYQVKYTVIDSEGNKQQFYRDVKVEGETITPPATSKKPVISFEDNIVVTVGEVFDPLAGVTAEDYKGQPIILDKSNIAWNKVNTAEAGTYQVKYVVDDSEGNRKIAYRTVIVKGFTGLKGNASLDLVKFDSSTNTVRITGDINTLTHVVDNKENNVSRIDSDVKYYLVAKDADGNEIFKDYMVRVNNGGSYSGFKTNLSLDELNKIQEGKDVTLSLGVETLGTNGELALDGNSLSLPTEIVDTARNLKYTISKDGNKVKISKTQNTAALNNTEVEENVVEEATEEVVTEENVVEEATEEVVTEENVVEEATGEVVTEENVVEGATEEVVTEENVVEEATSEVISDKEILELEGELLLEGDLIIE